ncbi:MAG: hypothetical protein ACK5RD_04125, partial [Aphanizomenon sp.]
PELRTIPVSKFCIEFDDGSHIEIINNTNNYDKIENNFIVNFYQPNLDIVTFDPNSSPQIKDFPIGVINNFIPGLERIATKKWLYKPVVVSWVDARKPNTTLRFITNKDDI